MPDRMNIPQQMLEGIRRFAMQIGHWRVVLNITTHLAQAAVDQWRFDGAIFDGDKHWLEFIEPLGVPMINVGRLGSRSKALHVTIDDAQVGRLAAEHLLQRRYAHFGFAGHGDIDFSIEREEAFRKAASGEGRTLSVYHQPMEQFPQARERALEVWLSRLPKPVAVFACNDTLASRTLAACHAAGLNVPADVALLGVDNQQLVCELARPALSSILYPGVEIGMTAGKLLEKCMQGQRVPQRECRIPSAGVVARTSTDVFQYGDEEVGEAMRFIREHAHEPIDVVDVLAAVPVSRSVLERRFRRVLGSTPLREIQIAHVNLAKSLLKQTSLSTSAIAERCGCRYGSHLSQLFKKLTGMSPSDYRNSLDIAG